MVDKLHIHQSSDCVAISDVRFAGIVGVSLGAILSRMWLMSCATSLSPWNTVLYWVLYGRSHPLYFSFSPRWPSAMLLPVCVFPHIQLNLSFGRVQDSYAAYPYCPPCLMLFRYIIVFANVRSRHRVYLPLAVFGCCTLTHIAANGIDCVMLE